MNYFLIVFSVAMIANPAGAAWAQDELEPVWWSPELGPSSLDGLDERIWIDTMGPDRVVTLTKTTKAGGETTEQTAAVSSCAEFMDFIDREYLFGGSSNDYAIQLNVYAACEVFKLLKSAQPSRISYIGGFALGDETMKEVSPLIGLNASCDFTCRAYAGDHFGVSWWALEKSAWEDTFSKPYRASFELINDYELVMEDEDTKANIRLIATGDFDGDGIRDVLIATSMQATQGSYSFSRTHILTRLEPGGILSPTDPRGYLCPMYACQSYYSYPSVLEPFTRWGD